MVSQKASCCFGQSPRYAGAMSRAAPGHSPSSLNVDSPTSPYVPHWQPGYHGTCRRRHPTSFSTITIVRSLFRGATIRGHAT
ncbi:hypothetical protein EDB83DRAFT_393280 [Lactarius deliciosus]|nr:hypothetical protein EDB83DRAFT_1060808 [Lactarius deliciosus]KAH9069714.1 hypothetical protein EDB83DRAFT_393280 [Lactarius deliciosus]